MSFIKSTIYGLKRSIFHFHSFFPFISSLSDDALKAVPRAMRDGSLAMGATRGETITRVLLPAALPGIVGGILLAASRAIGETMIVVMAAGLIARQRPWA